MRSPDFSLIGTEPAMAIPGSCGDPIVDAVRHKLLEADVAGDTTCFVVAQKLRERSIVGQAKYGVKLTRDDLTELQWLKHAQEEAMDLANYLEVLIQRLLPARSHFDTMQENALTLACELEVFIQQATAAEGAAVKP